MGLASQAPERPTPTAGFEPASSLTLQFLEYVAREPRTYAETMAAWRSTCPRLSIWEDALADGLVQIDSAGALTQARVSLTPRGRSLLDG